MFVNYLSNIILALKEKDLLSAFNINAERRSFSFNAKIILDK